MARLFRQAEAKTLHLPGRVSREIVSGERGSDRVSFRIVRIEPPVAGETPRGPHVHHGFEECIHVLSGQGATEAESGTFALRAGDTILVPAGELHVTRNTGVEPLVLLCFFPVGEVATGTREFPTWESAKAAP
jgi:mannose-6-phosphate isomerase-like protein (cupin superfamily)